MHKIITYKDVMTELDVSKSTAKRIISELRKKYSNKRITMAHFIKEFS